MHREVQIKHDLMTLLQTALRLVDEDPNAALFKISRTGRVNN